MSTSSRTASFESIDPSYLVEEETLSCYRPQDYYPARLGDVFHNGRYEVIGQSEYVALKVFINNSKYHRELPVYEEINNLSSTSMQEGQIYIRKMYDSFELPGPNGRTHICLVHQPLGTSISELKDLCEGRVLPIEMIRPVLRCTLSGLQFLHTEVRIIHTDLQPANMLLGVHDRSILAQFERDESEYPCPRKELNDRTIYMSRPMRLTKGPPHITDFSEWDPEDRHDAGGVYMDEWPSHDRNIQF
ncbi:hypothetical protein EJ03DRAFT_391544 [Teratosphaeria nubilosa]|uniref:non-specific serine/threonine protein kinase n=1 Tax=Teratosphaeria nubilosa TaxID=161662 RepID=A0A6G1KXS4_9PEZI|nr:hypothetical protein EJ03DRAFT_391544 [Teratosphaeria nubilosa]